MWMELSIRAREANFYLRLRDTKINRLEDRLNNMLVQILKGIDQHFVAAEIARRKAKIQADRKKKAIDAEVDRRKDGLREKYAADWRNDAFKLFVREGNIDRETADQMQRWPHSGFSVE